MFPTNSARITLMEATGRVSAAKRSQSSIVQPKPVTTAVLPPNNELNNRPTVTFPTRDNPATMAILIDNNRPTLAIPISSNSRNKPPTLVIPISSNSRNKPPTLVIPISSNSRSNPPTLAIPTRDNPATLIIPIHSNSRNKPQTVVILTSNRAILDISNHRAMMATPNRDKMLEATLTATKDR